MSAFEDEFLEKLAKTLTDQSLTSEDLKDYEDLFENDQALKAFAYGMHVATAKNGFREMLLALLQAGIPVEPLIFAQTQIWLQHTQAFDSDFDQDLVNNWMNQGMTLLQILYAASEDALRAEKKKDPSVASSGYAPELDNMYAQWREHMVFIEKLGRIEDFDQAKFVELSAYCQKHLLELEHNFVHEAKLVLSAEDLHSIWTDLLLQTFSFAYADSHEAYCFLTTYWDSHIYEHVKTDVLDLMVHFKGFEELLALENRPYLKAMVGRINDVRDAVQSGLLDPRQIDNMSLEDIQALFEALGKKIN